MKAKLIIAGLILAVCAVFIFLSLPPKSVAVEPQPAPEVIVIDTPEPEPKPEPEPEPAPPSAPLVDNSMNSRKQEMVNLNNDYRASHDLNVLTVNYALMYSAQWKADDMCNNNYFSHIDSNGNHSGVIIGQSGYYHLAGENLVQKYWNGTNAFNGLVASPSHLSNIVGDYREIGVGFNACGKKNIYAIHYGSR